MPKAKEQDSAAIAVPMSKREDAIQKASNLAELAALLGKPAVSWEEIEPSFKVANKEQFEGVPIVVGAFRMNESKKFMERDAANPDVLNPRRFVSLLVAAIGDEGEFISPWCIVNDGSTGIFRSLCKMVNVIETDADFSRDGFNAVASRVAPIVARGGFRRSDYPYEDEKGNVTEATTWYLAS